MKEFFNKPQQLVVYISIITAIISFVAWVRATGYNDNEYKNLRFETHAQAQRVISWSNRSDDIIFEHDLDRKIIDLKREFYISDTAILKKHDSDFNRLILVIQNNNELAKNTNQLTQKLLDIVLKQNNK